MNLHEYQAKQLFAEYGLPVSRGVAADTAAEAVAAVFTEVVIAPSFTDEALAALVARVAGVAPWFHIEKLRSWNGEEGFSRAQGE